jgi:glycosyltransferase involved in cell wall biosynthesis
LLHERLARHFETRLVVGGLPLGEHDMSYLLSSEENVFRIQEMSREVSFWADTLAFFKLVRFIWRERPDIVHTHTAKAGALGRLAAWLARVPVIVHTYHGHVFHSYFGPVKTWMYTMIERLLSRITTQVIAISASQHEDICSRFCVVPSEKTTIIPNGFIFEHYSTAQRVAARNRLGLMPDDCAFVWAGRMAPVKDVELLGQIIRRAAEISSRAVFIVVGDGEQRPELEYSVQDCGNVRMLGWRREMGEVWCAADAAILTSRNEGTPTVLIEAMAAGLPFIATAVGGVLDLAVGPKCSLPNGMGHRAQNGFLVERSVQALSFAVEQLVLNPGMRREMGAVGELYVSEKFSAERLAVEMTSLYGRLIQKSGKRRAPLEREKEAQQMQPT